MDGVLHEQFLWQFGILLYPRFCLTQYLRKISTLDKRNSSLRDLNFGDAEVVFAVMPFSELAPALDASTLATTLQIEGVRTKVAYLNRIYASQISLSFYKRATSKVSLNSLLSDWVFRDSAFGKMDDRGYLTSILRRGYINSSIIPPALNARDAANGFIQDCAENFDWSGVQVLCFVDTFAKRDAVSGQLMSSLALAKKVKVKNPNIKILISGPTTEGEMGNALRVLPFIDKIFDKDVHENIPMYIRNVLNGKVSENKFDRGVQSSKNLKFKRNLTLPIPNFDDYFDLRGDGLPGCFDAIPMETSKGCWWAESSHCKFCALPGSDVRFRSKTPSRALEEFSVQIERYRPKRIEMNDLIIDQSYFLDLFPKIAAINHKTEVFYETKSHLKKDQIKLLASAGVRKIQAGIESFSENTLKKMSKGMSSERNINFLKLCHDNGIVCYWNYLHSFPGETANDILSAIPLVKASMHLPAPATFQPVRVERFSPYHNSPERYGIQEVRPDRSYSFVYSGTEIDLREFAFYHEHVERNSGINRRTAAVVKLRSAIDEWNSEAKSFE